MTQPQALRQPLERLFDYGARIDLVADPLDLSR